MSGFPRISVVIPTYQRRDSVRRLLDALARQTIPAVEYEAIVVMDGSDDGTREMLAAYAAPFALVAVWQPNAGRAAARNAGIARARGALVVFLDDDMEPAAALLEAHRAAHPPGSRRAVVGPVPIPQDPGEPPIVEYRRINTQALLDRLGTPGYRLGFRDIYTGNLSVRTDVLREVGAFDATFTLYGHEDYEIALRLAQAGVELGYSPDAVAYQRYDKDFPAVARDCIARGQTAVLFAQKHPEAAQGLRLASYGDAPWRWRLLRSALLSSSALLPCMPEQVMRLMTHLERRRPRRLHAWYTLAIDYFFWLGARAALKRERQRYTGLAGVPLPMRIGVAVLVLFALASTGRLLARAVRGPAVVIPDDISLSDLRFRPLQQEVSPGERLGYLVAPISREPGADDRGRAAFRRLVLAQYALLPAILSPRTDAVRVVIDADSAEIDSSSIQGLTPLRDFGNGVMLFSAARK